MIQQLKLLPLVAGETVEQKVAAFRNMEDKVHAEPRLQACSVDVTCNCNCAICLACQVRRCLPDLLLATMSILYSQFRQTRSVHHPYHSPCPVVELSASPYSTASPKPAQQDGGQEAVSGTCEQ